MSKPTILITSATGKSGFFAVKYLLKKGFKVKAMARGKSQKTDELENLGAEVVFGNLLDITSVEVALQGIQRAYFEKALADAGVKVGLMRDQATELAIQTVLGAGQMVRDTGMVSATGCC